MTEIPATARQLFSTVTADHRLELAIKEVPVADPKDDEVLVRVEAAPINPSDLAVMISLADGENFSIGTGDKPSSSGPIAAGFQKFMAARAGNDIPIGNEGAGLVVKAGASPEAQALVGKRVAAVGGGFYADYRVIRARDCMIIPEGASSEEGASSFVNPLTSLGMIGTMRREGYEALIHGAAASNLGQMLVKLCQAEGIPLVNIVRSEEQVKLLKDLGAEYVLNSTSDTFSADLIEAIGATKAFIGFDPTGGGRLADKMLGAMEAAAQKVTPTFGPYGSMQKKQVYIYGGLQMGPTELGRTYGMKWGVGGWLLTYYLIDVGQEEAARMRQRVASELKTTFASKYTQRVSLEDAVKPEHVAAYNRKTTGEKYLIVPNAVSDA